VIERLASETGGTADDLRFVDPLLFEGVVIRRIVAYLLDVLLIAVLGLVAAALLGLLGILTLGLLTPLNVLLLALLPLAYHAALMTAYGATPGMSVCDLAVRGIEHGNPPDLLQSVVMTVLFYLGVAATGWLILVVALFNRRRRTMHDFFAGTVVVRRSRL
jgi:uncharacterized RDD family membrane protein YckC